MDERLQRLWDYFWQELFSLPSQDGMKPLFNPYFGCEPGIDRPTADLVRRENLHNYLASFKEAPRILVVGEAPGWRGCRFTGVPFTSEAQLTGGELPFGGTASSGWGKVLREASATIFWKSMLPFYPHFFNWNCLPLHPHRPGLAASNRNLSSGEIAPYDHLLVSVADILAPQAILAVGRQAQTCLGRNAIKHTAIRHPAHGGDKTFQDGVQQFFRNMGIGEL